MCWDAGGTALCSADVPILGVPSHRAELPGHEELILTPSTTQYQLLPAV